LSKVTAPDGYLSVLWGQLLPMPLQSGIVTTLLLLLSALPYLVDSLIPTNSCVRCSCVLNFLWFPIWLWHVGSLLKHSSCSTSVLLPFCHAVVSVGIVYRSPGLRVRISRHVDGNLPKAKRHMSSVSGIWPETIWLQEIAVCSFQIWNDDYWQWLFQPWCQWRTVLHNVLFMSHHALWEVLIQSH
jgi:hypothetical protein